MKLPRWIHQQFKKKVRIYIMPTRMGGYLCGLIFLMFLLAVGYNNNLLLIFTLLLFGLNLMWVVQTHFHLHALAPEKILIDEGHAGTPLTVTVHWKKSPAEPHRWKISLENEETVPVTDCLSSKERLTGSITFKTRGIHEFQHICIRTEMPFGLYQSWVYFPVQVRVLVYPALLKDLPPLPVRFGLESGEQASARQGLHDVWNLAPYQGEESRRISWKHYARSGELVVKEGEELVSSMIELRVPSDPKVKEFELSKLATQMVYCNRSEVAFSLDAGARKFPMGFTGQHLTECLRELARC